MLLGDMSVSPTVDKDAYVEDAANEIDSRIGVRYETPINVGEGTTLAHHSIMLLKKLNNHLATGRFIMAEAIGGEDSSVHAYGVFMVQSALREIDMIRSGEIDLEGVDERFSGVDDSTGPTIYNEDATPAVQTFYDNVMSPPSFFPPSWSPGS